MKLFGSKRNSDPRERFPAKWPRWTLLSATLVGTALAFSTLTFYTLRSAPNQLVASGSERPWQHGEYGRNYNLRYKRRPANPEEAAQEELKRLEASLGTGYLLWKSHFDMKQGTESPVAAEVNAQPTSSLVGPNAPTAKAKIQTAGSMTAELQGDKEEFAITPEGEVLHDLIGGHALWQWAVRPLAFGHGKTLRLLIRLKAKRSDGTFATSEQPEKEALIDVAVSPIYLMRVHKSLILGTGGGGGLLGILFNRKVRVSLRRLLSGRAASPDSEAVRRAPPRRSRRRRAVSRTPRGG